MNEDMIFIGAILGLLGLAFVLDQYVFGLSLHPTLSAGLSIMGGVFLIIGAASKNKEEVTE